MAAAIKDNPKIATLTKEIQIEKGKGVYMQTCFVCHQPEGQGVPVQIPPLAKSDFLMSHRENTIRGVLEGRSGEVIVNGKKYNAVMSPLNYLTDEQIANVVTYVRNSWGNQGDAVSPQEVRKIRGEVSAPAANPYE